MIPAPPPAPAANGKLTLLLTTPIGRLVQGDAWKPNTTDQQGAPLVTKTGPNAGQPRVEYYMGFAFQKGNPEFEAIRGQILAFAKTCWPHLYNPDGTCKVQQFSDKITDGDGYDQKGQAHASKEGFAGHWVLKASSGFAPQVYAAGRYNPSTDQLQPGAFQCGAFCRVVVTFESNNNPQKPGLYCNLNMVELYGMGAPIIRQGGPDAATSFGAAPVGAAPVGMTALNPATLATGPAASAPPPYAAPVAPAVPNVMGSASPLVLALVDGWAPHPAAPGFHYKGQEVVADADLSVRYAQPAPPPAPPMAPAAPPMPPQAPPPYAAPVAPAVPPYHGYAQPAAPPPYAAPAPPPAPPTAPAAPPVPTGPIMTAAAGGVPYEAYRANNWSDAQLIQAGFMLPVAGVS